MSQTLENLRRLGEAGRAEVTAHHFAFVRTVPDGNGPCRNVFVEIISPDPPLLSVCTYNHSRPMIGLKCKFANPINKVREQDVCMDAMFGPEGGKCPL